MLGYSAPSSRSLPPRRRSAGRSRKVAVAAVAAGLAAVMLSGCNPRDLAGASTGHQSQPSATPATTPAVPTTTSTIPTTTAAPTTTATTTASTTTAPVTLTTAPTSSVTSSPTTTTPPPTSTSVTPPPVGQACVSPKWTSSQPDDMWTSGDYIVHNNMWNAAGYTVKQTLAACSYNSWNVTATADNNNGDGAVKTYPNVHKDYHNWSTGAEPKLSSFKTIQSTFAASGPGAGIYDIAYDIWLNGVPGKNEVMIWTGNRGQTPSGSVVGSAVLSGITWDVWSANNNGYLAFVPRQPLPSGSLDLRGMLNYLVQQGRVPASSTVGQICFGVEVVSTGGAPATFRFTDFSVTDS